MIPDSFYFYDLETTGRDPRWHRVVQFAGVRTNSAFEPVEDWISYQVRPDDDVVPEPEALLVNGFGPDAWVNGIDERELFRHVEAQFSRPRTCVVGYNNLRFDDEFVRYGFWRTLRDPYAREWQGGNSRWDLIDLARMTAALRPEGLVWPEVEGRRSFRLVDLAEANGIAQDRPHEASSDVAATIGLAQRLRSAQPKLVDFHLGLRDKRVAAKFLPLLAEPCVHVSGRYPGSAHHLAVVVAVAMNPNNRNAVVVADLARDPGDWCNLDAETLRSTLFTKTEDLGDRLRPPLKEVHLNRVPALAPLSVLRGEDVERLGLDLKAARAHLAQLCATAGLSKRVADCYALQPAIAHKDALAALYGSFLPDGDRRLLARLRDADPATLAAPPPLQDPRARELVFEHLARSFPDALTEAERADFAACVRDRLIRGRDNMRPLATVREEVAARLQTGSLTEREQRIFSGLLAHLDALARRWQIEVP